MKFLLGQNLVYVPTYGGANKSNRMLLELLSDRGNTCLAVTPACGVQGPRTVKEMLAEITSRDICPRIESNEVISYRCNGVDVRAVMDPRKLRANFQSQINEFAPDWVIVSSEDTFSSLLSGAVQAASSNIVYLARTTMLLPFGPDSSFPDPVGAQRLEKTTLILSVSKFIQDYIARWGGLESNVVPLSFYGSEPFPDYTCFDRGHVTLVNPCAVKGISIFLRLATDMPQVSFAAVPTWGTTAADRNALAALPNATILPPARNIDEILCRTRILLVPSLWAEGKGEIVIEAMLRGIPVIAANIGGLEEAKLGVDYLLPICPIKKYLCEFDECMLPVPVVPEQDLTPWKHALDKLLSDRAHYLELSNASREAALRFAKTATVKPFLEALVSKSSRPTPSRVSGLFA